MYITMNRIEAPHCPDPKCGARMTRAYIRADGDRGQFVPIGWWCLACGETVRDEEDAHAHPPVNAREEKPSPMQVTEEDLVQFDRKMGVPGLGMQYVKEGVFILVRKK